MWHIFSHALGVSAKEHKMTTNRSAILAHYESQAAMCDPSAIAAIIRRVPMSLDELAVLIRALGFRAAGYASQPDVYGADEVSELLDNAAIACETCTAGHSVHDEASFQENVRKENRA